MNLSEIATACGYTIIEAPVGRDRWGTNWIEIAGEGDWNALSRKSMRWLRAQEHYDHVLLIVRDSAGRRRFMELSAKGERELPPIRQPIRPPAPVKEKPTPKAGVSGFVGVQPRSGRWRSRVRHHNVDICVGMYDTAIEAAMARDRYIVEHHLKVHLNFPHIEQLMQGTTDNPGE
jgi:hypothetical protein